jgi:DNA-binding transcriptional MerR regulator
MSDKKYQVFDNRNKEDSKKSKKDFRDKYFIKDIENITGIKAYTLRIWEQRYGMLVPKRTDTNIRYYEEDDLKYMMNIAILNANGYKISRIAKMSREEVQRRTLVISENNSSYQQQIQALASAMLDFDEREFNKILSINILKLGMEETTTHIIFPFLAHVGILWLSGSIHIAHEHFISSLIKQRMFVAIDQLNVPVSPVCKKFLLFLPNGENHELSLLFASFILRSRGHKVIYLGTSTPIDDLNKIFKIHNPDVIFCAITNSNQMMPVQVYMNTLSRSFPNTDVLLTGNQVIKRRDLKIPSNVRVIGSPDDFLVYLDVDIAQVAGSSKSKSSAINSSGSADRANGGYANGNGSSAYANGNGSNGYSNGNGSNGYSNGNGYSNSDNNAAGGKASRSKKSGSSDDLPN